MVRGDGELEGSYIRYLCYTHKETSSLCNNLFDWLKCVCVYELEGKYEGNRLGIVEIGARSFPRATSIRFLVARRRTTFPKNAEFGSSSLSISPRPGVTSISYNGVPG